MRGLSADLSAFDRRLAARSPRPLAVAFSGGGDSLALLLLTKAWADAHGRRVLALTVDHRLQAASAGWTERCRETAARLGVGFEALAWVGDKPATGLSAAARAARHRLLAEAAREGGASALLMGHTADDLLEAEVMRAEGSTVGDPREWAPSPVWPEGREVFLLRPLLSLRRAELREWLISQGQTWIDDPANENPRSARSRARNLLSRHPGRSGAESRDPESQPGPLGPGSALQAVRDDGGKEEAGVLVTARATLTDREAAAACLCVAGTTAPPRRDRLARLMQQLNGHEPFAATLSGARIEADADTVHFMREAGRRGLATIEFAANQPTVWDGRFEITASEPVTITPLKGHVSRLPLAEREALKAIPAAARPTLPAILDPSGAVTCPLLAPHPSVQIRSLVLARFHAATGQIQSEPSCN